MSTAPNSRIAKRLLALRAAIEQQSWADVEFHFDNVVRGVGRLVAEREISRLPDEEMWEPLRLSERVPLTEEKRELIRARGGDDGLFAELESSELWANALYTVTVTRWENGDVQELSIRRNDRQPVHDWRHFQMIKTQLAGPEVEAAEIYPAESRLMDTANQYYVFCLPPGQHFPMGYAGPRLLIDADEQDGLGSQQRALPEGWASTFSEIYGGK